MIVGVGIDLCDISRIQNTLLKYGNRFKKRCFTSKEIDKCDKVKNSAACFAKRFAAKEAVSKALGTGIRQGVFWKHIEVINKKSGKPDVILKATALDILNKLIKSNYTAKISVTITDEKGIAQAMVIIESIKENSL